jgi:hypothetical protein
MIVLVYLIFIIIIIKVIDYNLIENDTYIQIESIRLVVISSVIILVEFIVRLINYFIF